MMLFISIIIAGVISKNWWKEGEKTGVEGEKRVIMLGLIWSIILSINSQKVYTMTQQGNVGIEGESIVLYNKLFKWSYSGSVLEILAYIIYIIVILQQVGELKEGNSEKSISVLGIVLLLYVNDYISLYVTLECQSIILYILATRDGIGSTGLKYFIIGSLSSAIIILGIIIIYKQGGVTEIEMSNKIGEKLLEKGGSTLIILGLLIKLGVPPFHQWSIEVISRTKTDLTIWFSTISKIPILYLIKIISVKNNLLPIFILISLICGVYMGLIQKKTKRLLAYSGLIHLGFLLLLVNGEKGGDIWPGMEIYWYQYSISLVIILIISSQEGKVNAVWTTQGLGVPLLGKKALMCQGVHIIFIGNLLSLAGFPPLIGFVGKWIVLEISNDQYLLCLIAMLASVLSFFIYWNWVMGISMDEEEGIEKKDSGFMNEISFLTLSQITMIISWSKELL